MNLDLFDDMEGIILHEREASLVSDMKNNNGNGSMTRFPKKTPLAMAYVPFQQERFKAYSPEQGYMLGTMFQELNKPFCGSGCGDADD